MVNIKEWLFLNWIRIQSSLSPGYTESQVIEVFYFRMVDVLGNKNSKCTRWICPVHEGNNDY